MLGEVTPIAPLAEALQEMERYGPTNLVIRSPDVAALPIGGSYRIGNPGAFARVLPQILPVRLVRRDDGKMEIVGIQEIGTGNGRPPGNRLCRCCLFVARQRYLPHNAVTIFMS